MAGIFLSICFRFGKDFLINVLLGSSSPKQKTYYRGCFCGEVGYMWHEKNGAERVIESMGRMVMATES